jgi:hypothetical protein
MKDYSNKQELIEAIEISYNKFVAEFTDIAEKDLHKRIDGVDKTPAEMLAYQIGWLKLVLSWEKDEMAGKKVVTPKPNIKWNKLGELYQSFYEEYKELTLEKLLKIFEKANKDFVNWIKSLNDKILFDENQRQWASSTPSKWPVWKWIHINSVAPFTNFRGKIRKWKKG